MSGRDEGSAYSRGIDRRPTTSAAVPADVGPPSPTRRPRRHLELVGIGFAVVLIAAIAVGWLLDSVEDDRGLARWDESWAQWGADHVTSGWETVLVALTQLGSGAVVIVVLGTLAVVDGVKYSRWVSAWYLLSVGLGVSLLNNLLKLAVDRQRPAVAPLVRAAGSSFPSGHTATAAACWMAAALILGYHLGRRWTRLLMAGAVVIALIVAMSRVLLGVHWLTDVIAGLVVGWSWWAVVTLAFGGRLDPVAAPPT